MNCQVCARPVGDKDNEYKFSVFRVKSVPGGQVVICKGCIRAANAAGSGAIVVNPKTVIPAPRLAFLDLPGREEFTAIAAEEGWHTATIADDKHDWIDEHYEESLKSCIFGCNTWYKDVTATPQECFRESCKNIRCFYSGWLLYIER